MQLINSKKLESLVSLLWGSKPSPEIFNRWSQGFAWSSTEPFALLQNYGGPCSVIAPVQAFFIKRLFFADLKSEEGLPVKLHQQINTTLSEAEKKRIFVRALTEILLQVSERTWTVCQFKQRHNDVTTEGNKPPSSLVTGGVITDEVVTSSPGMTSRADEASSKSEDIGSFHQTIGIRSCSSRAELEELVDANYPQYFSPHGVLLFLYTCVLSRGVEKVAEEHDNPEDPMIDPVHGHGGQSMLNLMLSGEATPNVFDGTQDLSGLRLRGISHPCQVGFLTLLEAFKLCTVGECLKRPAFPVWVVGSESHYSVVFSLEGRLVAPLSARTKAESTFNRFASEDGGDGFIQAHKLADVLNELGLESEQDYVDIMKQTLDPDQLGIILLHNFIREFFQEEDQQPALPVSFDMFYYNGLRQSAQDREVRFRRAVAQVTDWQRVHHSDSPIEDCLQMRWPGLHLTWADGRAPSIN